MMADLDVCVSSEEEEEDEFNDIHAQWITNTKSKSELKSEAGEWKNGRWTPQELKTLKKNVNKFLKRNGIQDPAHIIFGHSQDKIRSEFYHSIAKNIQRPLFAVYRKACREFNVENYVHKWSKELEEQLLREHAIHGNHWATIGHTMGLSARAVRDKYRLMANRARKGEWTHEEEDKLVSAMKRFHGDATVDDVAVCPSVTWDQVAEHVGSRNGLQCRAKWLFTWPGTGQIREKRWTVQEDLHLLHQLMARREVEDEDEVDWVALSSGWEKSRSPHYLRNKWAILKRNVPNYSLKSYTENLEYLLESLAPVLEDQIKTDEKH